MSLVRVSERIAFWASFDLFTEAELAPWAQWVGSAPRLLTPDGDGSYAQFFDTGAVLAAIVRYAPTVLPIPLKIRAQVRVHGADGAAEGVQLFLTGNDSEYAYLFADTGPLPEGEWVTVEATFDPAEVADASSGLSSIGYAAGVVGPYDAEGDGFDGYDVSWVELVGAIPTRVYPRADGLGMGAPRIMDNRSPYTSPRVFGMI